MQQVDVTLAADDPVLAAVRAISGNPNAKDGQTLGELGLDSLALTGLSVEIETRTGIVVPEGTLEPSMSIAALRRAISAISTGAAMNEGEGEGGAGPDERVKRAEEATTWLPPLWLYTGGRGLRRLAAPIGLLHRWGVPRVITLGGEHLRALDRGVILAGTHRSYPDVPTIKRAIDEAGTAGSGNRLVIAASSVIVGRAGILGRFATIAFGLFPLRQYSGQEDSLRRLAQIADAGNAILIFPQGHHTDPADEQRGAASAAFKPGIGKLAADLELPVLPFGLAGPERVVAPKAPESFSGLVLAGIPVKINRSPVAIAFGAPLQRQVGETAASFAARLQAICFDLARQAEEARSEAGA